MLITWESKQFEAYTLIAVEQARAGDIDGDRKTATGIKRMSNKSRAYSEIAIEQAGSGDTTGAKETALLGPVEYWAYNVIAKAQAKAGDKSGAKKTFFQAVQVASKEEDDPRSGPWKSMAYRNIVTAQLDAGDIAGAGETASSIPDLDRKSYAYGDIAKALTRIGDKAGARRAAAAGAKAVAMAKEQSKMEHELWSWKKFIDNDNFYKPVFNDFQGFLLSLRNKNPHEVVLSLAGAAEEMADALDKIRDKETELQKLRTVNAK